MSNEKGTITLKQLNDAANEAIAFEKAKTAEIDALGPRRKKAEANLADTEQALAEAVVSTETGDVIERDHATLRQERTTEIGTAAADKRKANTAKIDAAIKAKEAERVAYLEALEVAKAATPILEGRVAKARRHLSNEVEAINKTVQQCEEAISAKWADLTHATLRFAMGTEQRAKAAKVVSRHFELAMQARYEAFKPAWAESAIDDRQWQGDVSERYCREVQRLEALGLPPVTERSKPEVWQAQNPTGWHEREAGIYDGHGRKVG